MKDAGLEAIVGAMRQALGGGLRSLFVFGSWLSPSLRKPSSVPDLFALVDDLPGALARLGEGRRVRLLSLVLPPVTLAFRVRARTVAKLNLVTPASAAREIDECKDLYFAGRFSKRSEVVFARDAACRRELRSLFSAAERRVVALVLLGMPRQFTMQDALLRCLSISYEAEIRPESPARVRLLFDAFAAHYRRRLVPRLRSEAKRIGLRSSAGGFADHRTDAARRTEAGSLRRLLRRGRLRTTLRWPKQMLVFRGWLPYLAGKIRRQ